MFDHAWVFFVRLLWQLATVISFVFLVLEVMAKTNFFHLVPYPKIERLLYPIGLIVSLGLAIYFAWDHEYRDVESLRKQLAATLIVDFQDGGAYFQGNDASQLYRIRIANPSITPITNVQARLVSITPEVIPPGFNLHFRHDNDYVDRAKEIAKDQDEYVDVALFPFGPKRQIKIEHRTSNIPTEIPPGEYLIVIRVTGSNVQSQDMSFRLWIQDHRLMMKPALSDQPRPIGPYFQIPTPSTHSR